MKQRTFLFFLVLLSTLTASAQTLINGIYYDEFNLSTKTVKVTKNPNKYSGSVVIPSTVVYRSATYNVTEIGDSAFHQCSGLTSITIPSSVTAFGKAAFSHCSGITKITIPNGVTEIKQDVFEHCSKLTSITIPKGVTSIGNYAFYYCSGLTSVTIPNSVTSIGIGAFYYCSGLTWVTIPNSVTSIGNRAFYNCSGLTSVTIPNSVTTIGNYTFSGCSKLTTIKIGSGVKSIGEQAFRNCSELGTVYCYADDIPTTKSDAFNGSSIEYVTLHVPSSLIDAYKATEPWNGFGAYEELPMPKCATPVITIDDGKVMLSCETEGVEYDYVISTAHVKTSDEDVSLPDQLQITAYAYKDGYQRSDSATKTFDKSLFVGTSGIRGDVNYDNEVGMPDVMFIVNYILNGKYPDEDESASLSCPDGNHPHMIDLGLPSGTKWACCNVGASKPEEYGNYYAWGETSAKSTYTTDTYLFYNSSTSTYFDLGRDIAGTNYDAATANWGASWCMPNWDQCCELANNTTLKQTMINGVHGMKITGKNGKSIFLPAAGGHIDGRLYGVGTDGGYRSSEKENCLDNGCANVMEFDNYIEDYLSVEPFAREEGWTVRPVRK